MAKAFDSVSLTPLRYALKCIRLPPNISDLILDIYNKRSMKVITSFGLTKGFQAKDEIDQEEAIFPLIWHIFYDPLLCKVQAQPDASYTMALPSSFNKNHQFFCAPIRSAASVFANDTIWLGRSKTAIQATILTIELTNSFFKLNDVKINGAKSELLVINSKLQKHEKHVTMGSDHY